MNAIAKETQIPREYAEGFIKILNPICPFITEEIWNEVLGHKGTISYEKWPTYDEAKTVENTVDLPVQVLGKVRGTITVSKTASQEEALKLACENDNISKFITGDIKKIIYVPGRILNIIV